MKNITGKTRTITRTSRRSVSAGPDGLAISPPDYGIDFFDHALVLQRKTGPSTLEADNRLRTPNRTGLPDGLKAGIESLSGLSLDDVRVHYNSPRPAGLQALAYTQGAEIHVGPGQERHLPHEAWHVVQQKQARVKPTFQMKGAHINDDVRLEKEADHFGGKALQARNPALDLLNSKNVRSDAPIQRRVTWTETTVNNMDLVDTVMSGADFGFTAIIVNGHDSDQFNPRALTEPTLFWSRSRDNTQVEINVAEEADNALGTRLQLPTAPPWERDVEKNRVGGRLLGDARTLGVGDRVQDYATADAGQITRLRVKGDPSDGALSRLTKTHEQRHVTDDRAAKEAIVDPWDARIAAKRRNNTVTVGADPTAALNQFYAEIGGSGADIGRDYMAECVRLGNAFHGTGPGGKPTMTSIRTAADQSSIEASWKHPVNEGLLARLFG